ncbi:FtsX-like permease family protein [bacterium]|jgi:putative ABC transport system permease protein|nr:FtsX-like permease family protein [bacterium]MBT4649437.1 FtsX-like permease family protein [bacterium]
MQYREAVKIAINALKVNKTRALLTILGIVIGIAAVLVVMSAGNSIEKFIFAEMDTFGTDVIQTEIKVPSTKQASAGNAAGMAQGIVISTLTLDDKRAMEKVPNIKRNYGGYLGQEIVHWQDEVKTAMIMASTHEYIDIDSVEIDRGRYFTEEEDDSLVRVVVLGSKIKESLFGSSEAIGQNIKIRKMNFRVIGVAKSMGSSLFFDRDSLIYIPIQTGQKLLWGIEHLSYITSEMEDIDKEDETVEELIALLRDRHDITNPDKDDFAIMSMDDAKEMMGTILGGVSLLLIALAAISLLVAGVGIMNIMYVSVAERTFEIGLRKAIGGKYKDIMQQFLTEAVVITFLGGVAGVILGVIVNYLIFIIAKQQGITWSLSLPMSALITSLSFAIVLGLVFGIFPAKKAAKLEPIAALRNE